jgi:predicted glycosyltransferase
MRAKPLLALSHGSRSQLLAAKLARIPTLVIFDYEFARALPGLASNYAMAPEVVASSIGHGNCKILKYPGIKEDVYVPQFKPDPAIETQLRIDGEHIVVTLRPPANEAHYRNPESEKLLQATIEMLAADERVQVILVPRNGKQASSMRALWPGLFASGKMIIPEHVVDGLNLIWYSDLVISGGGTMNREAAAMGVPVYSIFRGPIGAVDRYLAANGRLVLLESIDDVKSKVRLVRRSRSIDARMAPRPALDSIVNHIVAILKAQ